MIFRKLKDKDSDFMLEWMKDDSINKFFVFDAKSMTREKSLDFIANSFTDTNRHFACASDDDEYLGTISLKNIDHDHKDGEYAVAFRKKAHGKGCASFGTKEILYHAFNELDLNNVYLNVLKINTHAINFYKKIGFKSFEPSERLLNKYPSKDLVWYNISKEDFSNGK